MHHIVTDLQVVKIIDLLPLIEFFLFLLALLRPENITFGQHHEFQPRVFKSLIHMTVIGQNLSGLYLPHGIFCVYRCQSCILGITQILRQALCSGTGAGQ